MIFIWIARNLYEILTKKVDFWGVGKKKIVLYLIRITKTELVHI